LAPELAPQPPETKLHYHREGIAIRSLGRRERTRWGVRNTLRGIEAIRGICISSTPIVELRATLDGLQFYRGRLQEGYPLHGEEYNHVKRKYVFNIWHDFSHFSEGLYNLQLQFSDENDGYLVKAEQIAVGSPLREDQYPNSDRLVSVSAADHRSLEAQIN